jgi:hypothetical protein
MASAAAAAAPASAATAATPPGTAASARASKPAGVCVERDLSLEVCGDDDVAAQKDPVS